MSSSAQRKRRRPSDPPASRTGSKTGRAANANRAATANRMANPVDAATPPTETINVMDNTEDSVEEVVDLTCEGSEPLTVVDLTHSDSVLLVDEGPQNRTAAQSYIVSSDEDEDTPPFLSAALMSSLRDNSRARCTSGTISCPICMDSYSEIVDSGRLVVSTKCGHVFCSQCLRDALSRSHTCPTCRKKLTPRQYHPLYV